MGVDGHAVTRRLRALIRHCQCTGSTIESLFPLRLVLLLIFAHAYNSSSCTLTVRHSIAGFLLVAGPRSKQSRVATVATVTDT